MRVMFWQQYKCFCCAEAGTEIIISLFGLFLHSFFFTSEMVVYTGAFMTEFTGAFSYHMDLVMFCFLFFSFFFKTVYKYI